MVTSFPKMAPETPPKYPRKAREKEKMMWERKENTVRRRKCEASQSIFTLRRGCVCVCVCVCVCLRVRESARAHGCTAEC